MQVFSKDEVLKNKKEIVSQIAKGAVFIYPTDTIYGVGCDATNDASVKRIRELKGRDTKPLSVIAPSLDWIKENCELNDKAKSWLLKFPGPYTLILSLKNPDAVSAQTNRGLNTLGVRIPDHWISSLVADFGRPIITTSVNSAGKPPATRLDQFERFAVDFIIYGGEKSGHPSTIIDTVSGRVIKR